MRVRVGSVCRGAIALLLIAAVGLGVLPLSVGQPLLPRDETDCRFEAIDVCGAGDSSLGMTAETPVLLAEAIVVITAQTALPVPPSDEGSLLEGFVPGVYRPPRPTC